MTKENKILRTTLLITFTIMISKIVGFAREILMAREFALTLEADAYAASYYDQTQFIAHAMQKANATSPDKVGAQMYQLSYKGVAGTYAYDDKGNLKQAPITVLTFRNAAPVPLASY